MSDVEMAKMFFRNLGDALIDKSISHEFDQTRRMILAILSDLSNSVAEAIEETTEDTMREKDKPL